MGALLETITILFPLLMPIWEQRPLLHSDLMPGPYPVQMPVEDITFLATGMNYADADLRADIARNLGEMQSPVATNLLLTALADEKDPQLIASYLMQLRNLPLNQARPEPVVRRLLNHASPVVQFSAVQLYTLLPDADPQLLAQMALDTNRTNDVRTAAARALVPHAARLTSPRHATLAALRQDEDVVRRAAGYAATCRATVPGNNQEELIQQLLAALEREPVAVRFAIAEELTALPTATARSLCNRLAVDAHSSVRTLAAQAAGELGGNALVPTLLKLAEDRDPTVRRQAVISLANIPVEAAAETVVGRLADSARFVRDAAENSVVQIHQHFDMLPLVVQTLRVERPPPAHFHACRLLARIGTPAEIPVVAETLTRKHLPPATVRAALYALYELSDSEHLQLVLGMAGNSSELVREGVAAALANHRVEGAYNALIELAADKHPDVKLAALIAIGRLAAPYFASTVMQVMKATGPTSVYSGEHRNAACWAAARIRPVDTELMKRLAVQATTPVIPTQMGPVYESDNVLTTACVGLAVAARDNETIRDIALRVILRHATAPHSNAMLGAMTFIPSAEVQEAARQARLFMDNQSIPPVPRPTRQVPCIYRQVTSRN